MVTFELPQSMAKRIARAARRSGRSIDSIIREGILRYLDDLDDIHSAETQLPALREGRDRTYTLDEVMERFGVTR